MITQKYEDITSKEFLDKAIQNAKFWCQENLPKYLLGLYKEFDYSIFHYVIDDMINSDMRLDKNGLIRVSRKKLKWYQKREEHFKKNKIRESIEVDPESMFVHEITEFILRKPELFDLTIYLSKYFLRWHEIAREMENINRRERGLREWPKY